MVHIWSDDLSSGTTSDGVWDLQSPINGVLNLVWHSVDDGDIPWMFTGVNGLVIEIGAADFTVTFTQSDLKKTDAALLVQLESDIDTGIAGSGATVTVTYIAATDVFNLAFTMSAILKWSDVLSTSALVWNEVGSSDTIDAFNQTLDARYANNRPSTMELDITEGSSTNSTRLTTASLIIPLHDSLAATHGFTISGNISSLSLMWSRIYAPGIDCPFTLEWEMLFSQT